MSIVTKLKMINALNDPRSGFKEQYIGKALVAIFNFQTEDEKSSNSAHNHNEVGFSGTDAKDGCITAKYFLKHGTLRDWMVDRWMKDCRGSPRITKYARQLNIAAELKAAKQAELRAAKQAELKAAKQAEAVKPRFIHDAHEDTKPVFLGRDGIYDTWFHVTWEEIVLRFDNHPDDYAAMSLLEARTLEDYEGPVNKVDNYIRNHC